MIYRNITEVSTMWLQDDKRKRLKGNNKTNFNVKKHINLKVGDLIFINKNQQDQECFWEVSEILSVRQSTMKTYNYVETNCNYKVGNRMAI